MLLAPVHVSSRDGAAGVVIIFENWIGRRSFCNLGADVEGVESFDPPPLEVLAARAGSGDEVDLLPFILADIGNIHVARLAIERPAPRIAQSEGPDFIGDFRIEEEGIVGGNGVITSGVGSPLHVDTQHLSEEGVGGLSVSD